MSNRQDNNFALTKPCKNCPFTKDKGPDFHLSKARLKEIVHAPAFPCHNTVDYSVPDEEREGSAFKGSGPMQCAGLMSVLIKEHQPNQIMQLGERFGVFDPKKIEHGQTFDTFEELIVAHGNDL